MASLWDEVIATLGSKACQDFRQAHRLFGYVVVGSAAVLGTVDAGADMDCVLLASGPAVEAGVALPTLLGPLREGMVSTGVAMWFVNAMVPLIKVQRGDDSVDLLWQGGVIPPPAELRTVGSPEEVVFDADEEQLPVLRCFDVETALVLPEGPAADCVNLGHLFRRSLRSSKTFTVGAIQTVRTFARRRHLYGSKYGYPGGSAWCVLLWAFCRWLDTQPKADTLGETSVLHRFFTVLAVWPWPVPWTTENMERIVSGRTVDGSALEVSLSRHQATAFVVPLPTALPPRVWNMTNCVHVATQRSLLREAWSAALAPGPPMLVPEYRNEVREFTCQRHATGGTMVMRWPVYLSIERPAQAPLEWRGIVGARLIGMLVPQLEACGFFPRPLCVDEPAYLVLLWPVDAVWATHAPADLVLPLRGRILPCIFAMLQAAYLTLWGRAPRQQMESLLPTIDIQLADL